MRTQVGSQRRERPQKASLGGRRSRRRGRTGPGQRPYARHGIWALALFSAACQSTAPEPEPRAELAANRALWEAFRPRSYSYGVERICFCPEEWRGPVLVWVEGETVVRREYASSSDDVPPEIAEAFPSVDGLFETLSEALDLGASSLNVAYDPATGVPKEVFIDYEAAVADEELGFLVTREVRAEG